MTLTPQERAMKHCNQAAGHICCRSSPRDQPATNLIEDMEYKEAIVEINLAINELNLARAALAPLAEGRPRI